MEGAHTAVYCQGQMRRFPTQRDGVLPHATYAAYQGAPAVSWGQAAAGSQPPPSLRTPKGTFRGSEMSQQTLTWFCVPL